MTDHRFTDSAGQPWAGRSFGETPFADDDGSMPPMLQRALDDFLGGDSDQVAVVDALRQVRLLIPLVAQLGEAGTSEHGLTVDKSADLSIVTVAGPDGRNVLPAFGSVAAMQRWNPTARPVPIDAVRVALAAADEGTDLLVLDPGSPTEFVVRRPAVWAIARSLPWTPSVQDPRVLDALRAAIAGRPEVVGMSVEAGDPAARLRGPELVVVLRLRPALPEPVVREIISRAQQAWSADPLLTERVDSLGVRLVSAGEPSSEAGSARRD